MSKKGFILGLTLGAGLCLAACVLTGFAETHPNTDIILATTTSLVDSGLLDVLIPVFEKQTGFRVKTIAVGTGQALAMGEKGEADVLLTHSPDSEKKLVEKGTAIHYLAVMHNDFIVVGPAEDPAGISGKPCVETFAAIAAKKALFISRGDDSGTHKKELAVWKISKHSPAKEPWYQETGQGMGATLIMASEKKAYTLTDRGTYLSLRANLNLKVLSQGDPLLLNTYHVMAVNSEKFNKVNAVGAKAFVEFMIDSNTQEIIGNFGKDKFGQPLFFPDAQTQK